MGARKNETNQNYYRGWAVVAMVMIAIGTYFVVQTNASLLMFLSSMMSMSLIIYGLIKSITMSSDEELKHLIALMGIVFFCWTVTLVMNQGFTIYALVVYFIVFLSVVHYMDTRKKLSVMMFMAVVPVTVISFFYLESVVAFLLFATINSSAAFIANISSKARVDYLQNVDVILNYDILTGVPNRRGLYAYLKKHVIRFNNPWAILYVDLKKFRSVNTIYGQSVGDQVLIEFKNYLLAGIGDGGYLSRINGNEFVVLLKDVDSKEGVEDYLNGLKNHGHFTLPSGEEMHYAIGVSFFSIDATTKEDLLMTSNIALQASKEAFGNAITYYNQMTDMSLSKRDRVIYALENQLEDVIHLAVQPIKSMNEKTFTGFEALARMVLDDEIISPMEFIPLAESLSLIHEVDTLIMEKALEFLHLFKQRNQGIFRISVNVSKLSLNQNYIDRLDNAIKMYGIRPDEVLVEITETKIFTNKDEAVFFIYKLRDMGFNVAMDDFGSGYTSLTMIQSLPINVIKLDKSLIQGEYGDVMVSGLLSLLEELGLESIVEGVETEEQLEFIESTHASYIQGYLIDRPQMVQTVLEKHSILEKIS